MRPICPICQEREGWVEMFGRYVCGVCVSEWNKRRSEEMFKDMMKSKMINIKEEGLD